MGTRFSRFVDWTGERSSRRGFFGWLGAGAAALVAWLTGGRSVSQAQDPRAGTCPGPFTQFGFGSVQGACDETTEADAKAIAHANAASRAATMCQKVNCSSSLLQEDNHPARCQTVTHRDGTQECFCTVYDAYTCTTNDS